MGIFLENVLRRSLGLDLVHRLFVRLDLRRMIFPDPLPNGFGRRPAHE
jgi:hypothetical protein